MATLKLKKNKPLVAPAGTKPFTSPVASAIVTVIALLWTVPTLGLVVTSFRTKEEILSSGWWTSFTNPSFTLENFRTVLLTGGGSLGSEGMIPFAELTCHHNSCCCSLSRLWTNGCIRTCLDPIPL